VCFSFFFVGLFAYPFHTDSIIPMAPCGMAAYETPVMKNGVQWRTANHGLRNIYNVLFETYEGVVNFECPTDPTRIVLLICSLGKNVMFIIALILQFVAGTVSEANCESSLNLVELLWMYDNTVFYTFFCFTGT